MTGEALDQLLDSIDVRLDAFAMCEIARDHSLKCDPFNAVVVHFVLEGEGFLDCDQGRYRLVPGAVAIVPKKTSKSLCGVGPIEHVRDAQTACPLTDGLVSFRASEGEVDLVLGCAKVEATFGSVLQVFEGLDRPIVQLSEDTKLLPLFGAMLEELREPRVGTRALVGALMKQILIVLLRSGSWEGLSLFLATMNPRLAGVAAAILRRPQDNHTTSGLASSAGMSPSRFSHYFLASYHCTPREFVQSVRLASAAKLLESSDLPVKSIAASVGYASRSHFSRAFHAKYGLDPSAFRRASEPTICESREEQARA